MMLSTLKSTKQTIVFLLTILAVWYAANSKGNSNDKKKSVKRVQVAKKFLQN